MRKLLLILSVLFGSVAAGHAQDAGKAGPAQPIAFNHKLHAQTAKITCNECHEPRGNGSTLAMPQPPNWVSSRASPFRRRKHWTRNSSMESRPTSRS